MRGSDRPGRAFIALRAPSMLDRDEFLELVRRSRALHRPWVFPPKSAAEFAAYITRLRQHDYEGLLVCGREDRAIIGLFTFSMPSSSRRWNRATGSIDRPKQAASPARPTLPQQRTTPPEPPLGPA